MMAEANEDISNLVRSLVAPLVDFPDEIDVSSSEPEEGIVLIEIQVNEEDAGKVIGRQGRVIKAIRTVCRAAGSRNGMHVEIELID